MAKASNIMRSTPNIVDISEGITSPSTVRKAKKAASSWYMMSPLSFLYADVCIESNTLFDIDEHRVPLS